MPMMAISCCQFVYCTFNRGLMAIRCQYCLKSCLQTLNYDKHGNSLKTPGQLKSFRVFPYILHPGMSSSTGLLVAQLSELFLIWFAAYAHAVQKSVVALDYHFDVWCAPPALVQDSAVAFSDYNLHSLCAAYRLAVQSAVGQLHYLLLTWLAVCSLALQGTLVFVLTFFFSLHSH